MITQPLASYILDPMPTSIVLTPDNPIALWIVIGILLVTWLISGKHADSNR